MHIQSISQIPPYRDGGWGGGGWVTELKNFYETQNIAKWMTKTTSQLPDGFQPGYFQVPPEPFKDLQTT